jgi:mRNA interferase MazF
MTGYEFGDLVVVPFPFTDQTISKRRPAGVGEAAVAKWKEAGLLEPSVLEPVLATLERSLVLRKLGRLEEEDRGALREVLRAILGK